MKKNIGKRDKIIRIAGGIVIIALGIYYGSWLGVIGFVPLAVAFIGWCPVYSLLGIDSCPLPDEPKDDGFEDKK